MSAKKYDHHRRIESHSHEEFAESFRQGHFRTHRQRPEHALPNQAVEGEMVKCCVHRSDQAAIS
jgi:hypothetical protein